MTPNPDCPSCHGTGLVMMGDEDRECPRCYLDSLTLTRKRADSSRADVLRGERSTFEGEWVESDA